MKHWTPPGYYNAKPWVMMGVGAILCLGSMGMSIKIGDWTVWRGMGCFVGAVLVIAGGAILQLRQTYRANSKWRRNMNR
jgi:protein-S-isoprenylcysteine O-methyltransferase Ste14